MTVIFPDVEAWVVAYLKAELPAYGYGSVPVSWERGTGVPRVWVRRDGGPVLDQVREAARVSVNVFGPTEKATADLARTVSALLRAAADGEPVVRVTQPLGPSPVADATPRRFMSFELTVRGAALSPA